MKSHSVRHIIQRVGWSTQPQDWRVNMDATISEPRTSVRGSVPLRRYVWKPQQALSANPLTHPLTSP